MNFRSEDNFANSVQSLSSRGNAACFDSSESSLFTDCSTLDVCVQAFFHSFPVTGSLFRIHSFALQIVQLPVTRIAQFVPVRMRIRIGDRDLREGISGSR